MQGYNKSSADIKYFFEFWWGAIHKIYLDGFYFGGQSFNASVIDGRQFPSSPVVICPEDRNGMQSNLAYIRLQAFYEAGGILPSCYIRAEAKSENRIKIITPYAFYDVRIPERYRKSDAGSLWDYQVDFVGFLKGGQRSFYLREKIQEKKFIATRKWALSIKVMAEFEDGEGNVSEISEVGSFEVLALSLFRTGISWGQWDTEDYIYNPNAAAIGNLISHIGDKNALVVKKGQDELTPFLDESYQKQYNLFCHLYITFLTPTIERLKGKARLKALESQAIEMVRLEDVLFKSTKFEMSAANYRNKNEPAKMYYSYLLEVGEVKFLFKGKDWK